MSPLDKVKLAAMTLLITLALLFSALPVEGLKVSGNPPASEQALVMHDAGNGDDGVVKFVGSHQNHLLRLEHSLRSDDEPSSVVYERIMSWSQQAILLLLCGLLLYAALFYPRQSFRDNFASIHSRRLQRRHLQYRYSQSLLA